MSDRFLAQFTYGAANASDESAPADVSPANANALVTQKMAGGRKWLLDMKRVELGSHIATGMSGKVYNGLYDGRSVALKILRVPETEEESEALNKQFNAEFSTLQGLQHENVVKVHYPHTTVSYGCKGHATANLAGSITPYLCSNFTPYHECQTSPCSTSHSAL